MPIKMLQPRKDKKYRLSKVGIGAQTKSRLKGTFVNGSERLVYTGNKMAAKTFEFKMVSQKNHLKTGHNWY